ncbi:Uncharacterised protein [Halioglobus japonicus]|nr:Uncharacterised protein [Halioglobus japonicus]
MQIIITAVFLLAPALLIWLAHHQRWAARVGVIVLCYMLGLVLGNTGVIPVQAQGAQQGVSEVTIALALPLLLFTLDIRQWSRVAGKALLSMVLANAVVFCLAVLLYFAYRDSDPQSAANLAAMSVGVYTGGTPNLAAIRTGLDIPNTQYLVFHSMDTLIGTFYFLFMLTLGVPLFRALLPGSRAASSSQQHPEPVDEDDYRPLLRRTSVGQIVSALLLAALVVGASLGLSQLLSMGEERNSAVLIVALTTLGIALSLHRRVRGLTLSYRLGMYLIYVFCIAVSSMVSFNELLQLDSTVVVFLLVTVFAGLVLHALLCRLTGVDSDTFMVTSVAAVGSPPFVPLMARALNNPGTILVGMTTGVIGYALGSYLGISLGLYLRSL